LKLREAHGFVRRNLTQVIDAKRRRDDILVSYLGPVGKRGASYAKKYADENQIRTSNVVDGSRLVGCVRKQSNSSTVVLVDDFIGTGNSAIEFLKELHQNVGCELVGKKVLLVAICGFTDAQDRIEDALEEMGFEVGVYVCDPLDRSDQVFSPQSTVFPDSDERGRAEQAARQAGRGLVKDNPLGYGDCQALVVFEDSCPNNSLPILWSQRAGWHPLLPRPV